MSSKISVQVQDFSHISLTDLNIRNHKTSSIESDLNDILDKISNVKQHAIKTANPSNLTATDGKIIQNLEHYSNGCLNSINNLLNVPKLNLLKIQAEIFDSELSSCDNCEHSPESIHNTLQTFFTNQLSELMLIRQMYASRWHKWSANVSVLDNYQLDYTNLLSNITKQYDKYYLRNTCRYNTSSSKLAINPDDFLLYLNHTVMQMYSSSKIDTYIKLISWSPAFHCNKYMYPEYFNNVSVSTILEDKDRQTVMDSWTLSERIHNTSFTSYKFESQSLNSSSLTSDTHKNPSYATYNAKNTYHVNDTLPSISLSEDAFSPNLKALLSSFDIHVPLLTQASTLNSKEIFYHVQRNFKHLFQQQTQTMTFQLYKRSNSYGKTNSLKSKSFHSNKNICYIKSSILPFSQYIWPSKSSLELYVYQQLYGQNRVDELLKCHSQSLRVHQLTKIHNILQQHDSIVRTPLDTIDATPSLFWRTLYGGYNSESTLHPADTQTKLQNIFLESGPTPLSKYEAYQVMNSDACRSNRINAKSQKNDAYSAFLMLRHLKLRELRFKCLNFLNYFRSIEQDVLLKSQCCATNFNIEDNIYKSYGITRAKHLFPTEVDYLIHVIESNTEMAVHNSDSYNEKAGHITVYDQNGYSVIYRAALTDLDNLDDLLILIGSHYLLNDLATNIDSAANENLTLPDRYAVLLDLWTLHVQYLHSKRAIIDLYYECFLQSITINDRHKLAEIMLSIIWQRPILDLEDSYFKKSYLADIDCLKKHITLIQSILNSLIIDSKNYPHTNSAPNLNYKVSVNHSIQISEQIDLLQLIPMLAKVHLVYSTIQDVLQNLTNIYKPNSTLEEIMFATRFYSLALIDWNNLQLETEYSHSIQTNLFSSAIFSYPSYITEFYKSLINDISDLTTPEGYQQLITISCKLLDLLSLYSKLTLCCRETLILSRAYRAFATLLGFEESHAFLRYSPMEAAVDISQDDVNFNFFPKGITTKVDRITPTTITFAVDELDDCFAKFSFNSAKSIRNLLETQEDRQRLITTLKVQIINRNVFVTCCQLLFIGFRAIHSEPNSTTLEKSAVLTELQKYFLSAQFMKTKARQNLFISYSNEIAKGNLKEAKLKAINDYCQTVNIVCKEYVTKTQISKCYTELYEVMKGVDSIISNLFVTKNTQTNQGEIHSNNMSTSDLLISTNILDNMLISTDGAKVMNLWYLPSLSEIIFLNQMRYDNLITLLELSSNLAFILHYLLINVLMSKNSSLAWTPHRAQVLFLDSDIEQSLSDQIIDFRDTLRANLLNDDVIQVCSYLKQYSQSIFLKHYVTLKYLSPVIFLKNERHTAFSTCRRITPLLDGLCTGMNLANNAASMQYRFINELEVAQLFPFSYLLPSNIYFLSGLPLALKPSPAFSIYFTLGEFRFEDRLYIMAEVVSLSLNCIDGSTPINRKDKTFSESSSEESLKYLNLFYIFHLLKVDWILKMLKIEQITNSQDVAISEELTEMYINIVAIQNLQKAKKTIVKFSNSDHTTELLSTKISLIFEQIKLITRSLYYHLMVECINYVNAQLSLLVANKGLYEEKVPLEVWMKPSTREISIQTPVLVADFMTSFLQNSRSNDENDNYIISKDQFEKLIANLSEATMNREKFLYKNYSSFYEDQIKTQSLQLIQNNEEINQLTHSIECIKRDYNAEVCVGIALSANKFLLENLQLKLRLYELNKQLIHINVNIRIKVKQEYDLLVQSLLQTILSIKGKYEVYRTSIYEKMLDIVYFIRSITTDNIDKMVNRVSHDIPLAQFCKNLKNTQLHEILLENSNLTKQLTHLQSTSQWNVNTLELKLTRKMEMLDNLKEETDFQIIRLQEQHDEFIIQHDKQLQIIMKETATLKENLQNSEKDGLQARNELKELQEAFSTTHSSIKILHNSSTTKELSQMATVQSLLNHVKEKDIEIEWIKHHSNNRISLMEACNKQITKDVTRLNSQLTREQQEKHEAYRYLQDLTESKLDNYKVNSRSTHF